MMNKHYDFVVTGGGAAGFFAAINFKIFNPGKSVIIIEKSSKLLAKVRISGGGRCNVTNACEDETAFLKHYPRGEKELRQVFAQFSNKDTIKWFEERKVKLKTEPDGRMFPVTDNSQTIIDCLLKACEKNKVEIETNAALHHFEQRENTWHIITNKGELTAQHLMVATGGNTSKNIYELLDKSGHRIVPEVPSLFTFNIKDKLLHELQGLSMPGAVAKISGSKLTSTGPVLITHWGLSGPCILKLSAIGARYLHELDYNFEVEINWVNAKNPEQLFEQLQQEKSATRYSQNPRNFLKKIQKRLWSYFIEKAGIEENIQWAQLKKENIYKLAFVLSKDMYKVEGKTTFKEEFVTAGGISLKDIDMKTMQSKKVNNLWFAGEITDVDGLTGGFNFQAAWSQAWVAARNIG